MKKFLILLIALLALSGCKDAKETATEPTQTPEVIETLSPEKSAEPQITKTIEMEEKTGQFEHMQKFEECHYDITNSGGAEEYIYLLTDAQKDASGEFLWDDSHNWALVVENEQGVYPLFREYRRGNPELNVSEVYEGEEIIPVIRLTLSSSASYEIREYRFENGKFYESIPYSAGAINEIPVTKY